MAKEGEKKEGEKTIKGMTIEEALSKFGVEEDQGLSDAQIEQRLQEYGPNALPDVKENQCLKFLSFMWNPLSWVMEAAALVAIILSNGPTPWLCEAYPNGTFVDPTCLTQIQPPDWEDFIGILLLLILNSTIGYYEESAAGAAVNALMDKQVGSTKVPFG